MTDRHKASMVLALSALADVTEKLTATEYLEFLAELGDELDVCRGQDRGALMQALTNWTNGPWKSGVMAAVTEPLSEAQTLKAVAQDMRNVGKGQ